MTIARAAEAVLAAFPDCFVESSPLMQKKRMIGLLNDRMASGGLTWITHRGQRSITAYALDAFLDATHE